MPKTRSPSYPAIGLKEAIEKVRAVYDRDYQNAVPREVVAGHMGYQGLNGKSLGVLSALSKFGLLEGRGNETRVSDLAVMIIAHPPGSPERAIAIGTAAIFPELFKTLEVRFPGKASDQALRSYLLTQKFIPSAADAVIRAYRETKALVEDEGGAYDSQLQEPAQAVGVTAGGTSVNAVSGSVSLPKPPTSGGDPYYFTYTPSIGFEGGFRLNNLRDFELLINSLQGFKMLYTKTEDIPVADLEDDEDLIG